MTTPSASPHLEFGLHADAEAPSRYYRAYGLLFRSSIPMPELTPVARAAVPPGRQPDATIGVGSFPAHLEEPLRAGRLLEVNAGQILLRVKDVGRYLVSRGSEIIVEPHPNATEHDVRVFLLGTCMGGLLHQRGLLVLHASGVGTAQGAALFAGASGAGKSTLLAELLRREMRMVVDDVCAIRVGTQEPPIVVPSYPRTRLWGETAERLSINTVGLPRTRPDMDKFERQVPQQFWDQEAPLVRLYHLAGSSGDQLSLTRLGPLEAFETVLNNTYRKLLLVGEAPRKRHFEMVSVTSRAAPVMRVLRTPNTFQVVELADMILQDLEQG